MGLSEVSHRKPALPEEAAAHGKGAVRRILRLFGRLLRRLGPEPLAWKGQAHLFGLAIVSALLLRLAYPRWNMAAVSAVGLVPLLWALGGARSGKQAFYIGWLFGAVFYYVLMVWLNILVKYHFLMPAALVAMSLYLGLFKGLFAWIVWRARAGGGWVFVVAPAAWVGLEYLQSLGDLGFPWGYLGHSLWLHPALIQPAAWTGVYGLSFGLFWINQLLCDAARRATGQGDAPSRRQLAARMAVLALLAGAVWLSDLEARRQVGRGDFYCSPPVTVGIVQPNIPQEMKFRSYGQDVVPDERQRLQREILRKTIRLTDLLQDCPTSQRSELIVWPETAITDDWFAYRLAYRSFFDDLATTRWGAAVFFGATNLRLLRRGRYVPPERLDVRDYERNFDDYSVQVYVSAWFAEPGRGLSRRVYNKIQLVPFAEGIPYVQRIEPLRRLVMAVSGMQPFSRGREHTVYDLRDPSGGETVLRFGPLICYESIYPHLSRALVRGGAQLLVVITNDAWYEQTAGPEQHQLESVFRAVETRRWVVRCANHGISCFISPLGEIVEQTRLARDAVIRHEVRGVKELTFYARWGDVFAWLMIVGGVGIMLIGKGRR